MSKEYPALTVKELLKCCEEQIEKGNGDKKILISADDEGNGYHGLFYQFMDDREELMAIRDMDLIYDNVAVDEIVVLG